MIWQLLHASLLKVIEFYPYPELVVYPYLKSLGWLPYAQILDQHFPGLMFFPVNLNSLGFVDPGSLQLLLILIVLVQSALVYKIARHSLAIFLFAVWQPFFEGNQLWIDVFLALFTLPAWLFFNRKKYLWAGLFLGVGVVFKQTLVPLVAFAGLYLLWQHRLKFTPLLTFVLGALLPSLVMLLYLAKIGVGRDFWYWAVQFNLTAYAQGGRLAPTVGQWLKLSWPIIIVVLSWWRLKPLRPMVGWMAASLVGGVARFGFVHLQPGIPFFSILYAALVLDTWKVNKFIAALLVVPTLVWAGWFVINQREWQTTHFYSNQDLQVAAAIESRTNPGDHIFLLGVNPHIYQISNTVPAGGVYVFQFPWFLEVAGPRVLTGLKNDPPRLVIYDPESSIDGRYLKDYADYLVEYTVTNYQPVATVGSTIIYQR